MKALVASLSPHEETTLLRIGFGTEGDLDAKHVRRLLQLELIEWGQWKWRLTDVAHRRYATLVNDRSDSYKPAA